MLKFIVTKELGKLARWLRILGFDTIYYNSDTLGTLIIEALSENRIVVTRRRKTIGSLEKSTVVVSSDKVKSQVEEITEKLGLTPDENKMFSRCVICNTILESVDKNDVRTKVPEHVFKTHNEFMKCVLCGRIYWKGTHWGNILKSLGLLKH